MSMAPRHKALMAQDTPSRLAMTPLGCISLILALVVIQDTVSLFMEHRKFTLTSLCTDYDLRSEGGKYAHEHCAEHENVVNTRHLISTWIRLFCHANYKLVCAAVLAVYATQKLVLNKSV